MIVINGDSYSDQFYFDNTPEVKWSNIINADHNLSVGGSSNDRIFITTLDFLAHTKPDVLIIGWSNYSRWMRTNDQGTIVNLPHHEDPCTKFFPNKYSQFKNTLNYMYLLQEHCKHVGIKLIYFMSVINRKFIMNDLPLCVKTANYSKTDPAIEQAGFNFTLNRTMELIDKLDPSIWINNQVFDSIEDTTKHLPTVSEIDMHPGVEASREHARIINKKIQLKG